MTIELGRARAGIDALQFLNAFYDDEGWWALALHSANLHALWRAVSDAR